MNDGTRRQLNWRYLLLVIPLGLVLYQVAAFRSLAFIVCPVALLVPTAIYVARSKRQQEELLLGFRSRQDLSDYIDRTPRKWTRALIWLEYAIAERTVSGAYHGERPSALKEDWYRLNRELWPRTKGNARFLAATGIITACLSFAAAWLMWDLHSYLQALVYPTVVVFGSVYYYFRTVGYSDDPQTLLARKVYNTRSLPSDERWERLLAIARDDQLVTRA